MLWLLERILIAFFIGLISGLVVLFLCGMLFIIVMGLPGSAPGLFGTKMLLFQIPVASAALIGVCSLFAPEKTIDAFGNITQKLYKSLKEGVENAP
jgi:hypothetical protein